MSKEAKRWWEANGRAYQDECRIPIDVQYGAGSPNENDLGLIGAVAGKRLLEIGCGGTQCSIAFAKQGAILLPPLILQLLKLNMLKNLPLKMMSALNFIN